MFGKPLLLRHVLFLTIGSLALLTSLLIARDMRIEIKKLINTHALLEAANLGDAMFTTSENLSLERDEGSQLLQSREGTDVKDMDGRLERTQSEVDSDIALVLASLQKYDFDDLSTPLQEVTSQYEDLKKARKDLDRAAVLPLASRDPLLSQKWFDSTTSLILKIENISMKFSKHFINVDPMVFMHMRFKHTIWNIMEYSGRQRAVIGRLLAENADPTPEEQTHLIQWQGIVTVAWGGADILADQSGLYPAIAPALQDAKSHSFLVYNAVKDIFYVPGARHGGSYPISAKMWLDVATQTTDSLNALKDAALRETHSYVNKLEVQARQTIYYHALFLIFAILLWGYGVWMVIHRVVRPIDAMVKALVDATEGKPVSLTPPTYSRQDEIGKLAYVLHVFQQNASEIKRTSDALGESEKRLYQAQKMEAIGNLTGGMAHDFNNLLGVVIGNLDLLIERVGEDPVERQLSQAALDASLRGADLTKRLLAFARQQPLQPESVDVNKLVDDITRLLKRTLGENIEVTLDMKDGLWPVVADPAQLESAITNLATNARDAMPGGGRLIIGTHNSHLDIDYTSNHSDLEPGDYVMIEVTDTGTGVPSEIINRIFEPFFTTKERGKGTGLGLAMAFGFVKQSGGHISVYSELGLGTTFRLYLPRAGEKTEAIVPKTPISLKGGHETILVVEDNEDMRRIVARQLKELGYSVLEAAQALAALETLSSGKHIDLLFTDIVMPGKMNGIELARVASERWPSMQVVLTSGFPENKLNGHQKSAIGFRLLSKPYRKEQLAQVIREALEGPTAGLELDARSNQF